MVASTEVVDKQELDLARVHVVDDDAMILDLVAEIVRNAGLTPVTHKDADHFLADLQPDEFGCAVLDLVLPGEGGLSILRRLHETHPDIPVVMVSGHGNIACALEAVRCGAVDFIEKPFHPDALLDRVFKALKLASQARKFAARVQYIQSRIDKLTPREAELLPLLCSGRSIKGIAFDLGLSPKTVQIHRARILEGMGVESLVDLANLYHEFKTLPPTETSPPE